MRNVEEYLSLVEIHSLGLFVLNYLGCVVENVEEGNFSILPKNLLRFYSKVFHFLFLGINVWLFGARAERLELKIVLFWLFGRISRGWFKN